MSIGEPILLKANHSSYIVTLTKHKLVAKYKPLLEKRGYKVQDLNFVHPEKSDISYDPLQYVRTASCIYSIVFKQLFEFGERCPNGKLSIPVHVLCDDFATGGRILNFPELISIFREKQISVTLLLQSESQLEAMYGSSATTIINNCDTYIFMGTNDLKTAQSVSVKMNVPLEDILWMPIGEEIIFRRGQRPIMTQRYNILENELYRKVTKQYERTIAKNNNLEHQIA